MIKVVEENGMVNDSQVSAAVVAEVMREEKRMPLLEMIMSVSFPYNKI